MFFIILAFIEHQRSPPLQVRKTQTGSQRCMRTRE